MPHKPYANVSNDKALITSQKKEIYQNEFIERVIQFDIDKVEDNSKSEDIGTESKLHQCMQVEDNHIK